MSKNAGSPGAENPVAVDVRVRRAPLAGDGVDAFDVLAAGVVERLGHEPDALVLAHARGAGTRRARRRRRPPSRPR